MLIFQSRNIFLIKLDIKKKKIKPHHYFIRIFYAFVQGQTRFSREKKSSISLYD